MRQISMARLTRMFAWIGFSSVGGGRSAYIYDMLVERHAWFTREEFLPGYTLSQLLPGPTISNLSVFLGHGLRGVPGALIGLIAVLLPGAIAVVVLAGLYFDHPVTPLVEFVLRGMGAAVVGFLCVTVGRIGKGALRARGAIAILGLTFLLVGILRLNTFLVILVLGVASLCLNRPRSSGEIRRTVAESKP
jgi:chromate transporter